MSHPTIESPVTRQRGHEPSTHPPEPTKPWVASTTAALGVGGGVALFCDLALHAFGPLGRSYYVLATAMAMCLLGVPAAYWQTRAMAPGWRRRSA